MSTPAWLPTSADLATFLMLRTVGDPNTPGKGRFGAQTGGFSSNTTPTAAQVDVIISRAAMPVRRLVGTQTDEILVGHAVDAILCRSAARVEQASANPSEKTVAFWQDEYKQAWTDLKDAVHAFAEGDAPGPDDQTGTPLVGSWFPPSSFRNTDGTARII